MIVTIQDPATAAVLPRQSARSEVYGPDGRLLGRFTCPSAGNDVPRIGADEEMNRRLNDPTAKWVTGDEVMARLRLSGTDVRIPLAGIGARTWPRFTWPSMPESRPDRPCSRGV